MSYGGHTQSAPDVFIAPYFEDVFGGTNTYELLKIANVWNTEFIGAVFWNYYAKTNGVINLSRAGRTKITGSAIDTATPMLSNFVNIGRASWECDVDLVGINQASVIDFGVNSKIGSRWNVTSVAYDAEAPTLQNIYFDTPGAGGADVAAIWYENGAADLSQDPVDLIYSNTSNSLKCTKGTPAAYSSIGQTTRNLTAGKTYWVNITYKNDSASAAKVSPITLSMQKVVGGYVDYNWIDGTWTASNSARSLQLPIVTTPYTVSIPFIAPASTGIQLTISFAGYSPDNDGATYHVFRASIDTMPNNGNLAAALQSPLANVVANSIPYADSNGRIASYTGFKWDPTNKTLCVGTGADASPTVAVKGTSNANTQATHTGAGADLKTMLTRTAGGITSFSSLTDAGGYKKQNILKMDHSTGTATVIGTYLSPFCLGTFALWVEAATGKLRIKSGTPSSDNDGTVVGSQT
ncbi:hypothetical protein CCP3SC15_1990002 [Gammaproteobacteria bacterium]